MDYTETSSNTVTLHQELCGTFKRLVHAFQRIGVMSPLIHGGALRDHFLGIPHADIDIRVPLHPEELGYPEKSLITKLRRSHLFANVSDGEVIAMGDIALRFRFNAEFEGHVLDIIQDTVCPDIRGLIRIVDAPINAAVIDPASKCYYRTSSF